MIHYGLDLFNGSAYTWQPEDEEAPCWQRRLVLHAVKSKGLHNIYFKHLYALIPEYPYVLPYNCMYADNNVICQAAYDAAKEKNLI